MNILLVAGGAKLVFNVFVFILGISVIQITVISRCDVVLLDTVRGIWTFSVYLYLKICAFSYMHAVKTNLETYNTGCSYQSISENIALNGQNLTNHHQILTIASVSSSSSSG